MSLLQVLEASIEARPGQGVTATGGNLPEYRTPGYGDSRRVDLRATGEMLGSIRVVKVSARGGVIECSLRHPRAVFMNRRFPFMGLLADEAEKALRAAEAQHGQRLSERVRLNTRKGGNGAALSSLRGLTGEVAGG